MDEMNNMNEVTTEETSNEMTPVVTENNEVKTEANSGINPLVALGGAAVVGGVVYVASKLKSRKGEKKVKKEKPKKHIEFCKPWKIVKDEPEVPDAEFKEVEETEEEN